MSIYNGRLAEFASSNPVMRGFCETCASSLTYRHSARPDKIDITIATFDYPAGLKPRYHVWVSDKLPRVKIDYSLPQFKTAPPKNND